MHIGDHDRKCLCAFEGTGAQIESSKRNVGEQPTERPGLTEKDALLKLVPTFSKTPLGLTNDGDIGILIRDGEIDNRPDRLLSVCPAELFEFCPLPVGIRPPNESLVRSRSAGPSFIL